MICEVEIEGRLRTVRLEPLGDAGPTGGRFRVRVLDGDGNEPVVIEVDARVTDVGLSLVYADTGRSVDAALTERTGGAWLVQLPHVDLTAVVDGRRSRRGAADAAGGTGEQRMTAPMPGRVLRVLVAPGDEVQARQSLLVLEAMKMENDVTALRAGRVREVLVEAGTSVESGRLLVVIG